MGALRKCSFTANIMVTESPGPATVCDRVALEAQGPDGQVAMKATAELGEVG